MRGCVGGIPCKETHVDVLLGRVPGSGSGGTNTGSGTRPPSKRTGGAREGEWTITVLTGV